MYYTESHFGLIEIDGKISADGGKTFLKKYADITPDEYEKLVFDIENHIEHELVFQEHHDLKEILE